MIDTQLYTPKQIEVLERSQAEDWFMLILHGGVRSGKTFLNNDLFLLELLRAKANANRLGIKEPMYILAATSSGTLQTNILQELANKYDIEFKFDRYNNFKLFGVKVITTFTKSIGGLSSIRGMTAFGAYVNEGSLANDQVFSEIVNRCSGEGARILVDTNPDIPTHWLKESYIDKADDRHILAYHFTIFDNSFLNQRYIDSLIATTPTGTLADRAIYGRWTIGAGAIYTDYNAKTMEIQPDDVPRHDIKEIICGVDWGWEHHGSIVVIAVDFKDNHYLIEEHAHQHMHIEQWIDIAKRIQQKYGPNTPFYCDSARPEYVDAFYYSSLNAMNANKNVIPGITEVAKLMKTGKFYVSDAMTKFKAEVNQYVWAKTGDRPIDKNDDVLDAIRYAIYTHRTNKGVIY